MERKNKLYLFFLLFLFVSCTGQQEAVIGQEGVTVIPQPLKMETKTGEFKITSETKILAEQGNVEALRIAGLLVEQLNAAGGLGLKAEEASETTSNSIYFTTKNADNSLGKEGYTLTVNKDKVIVKAFQPAGLFYALQSVYQLLPPAIESISEVNDVAWTLPAVEVVDTPRYSWRGLHLDVSRHFMPVEFIKKYIDNMAMHKLNTFHWHLTDDQGWRIEIKKYPRLTEVGAWRNETLIGHSYENPKKYDGKRYGGFYTQEEVKEIVRYAAERYITVVPEIELPGHASAAIAAYPKLGVTGNPINVVTSWGIFPDIFNVEDSTFLFLEDVLTEVMELFPSEYIHIGGDEAIKDQWEASPRVQQQIKQLGLKDEHELQSYFITRIEKFINSKGRKLIGWDEILEGGLAPNAAVMSWRGTEGGEAAAKAKHYVVMSPASHVYFDYYQGNPGIEPLAIGGFTPIKKVYSYEPTPESLTKEEAKYILGAQANVWTEYMKTPEHVEYMVFPRISALAEVVWSPKESRDWELFKSKLPEQLQRYELRGIDYSKTVYGIAFKSEVDSATGKLEVVLENELGAQEIRYTLDGSAPTNNSALYKDGIKLTKTATIKAQVYEDGKPAGNVYERTFNVHKAYGKVPQLTYPYYSHHFQTNDLTITDGVLGTTSNMFSDVWQRYKKVDVEATIDLGKTDTLRRIRTRFVNLPNYSIVPPKSVSVYVSMDGNAYVKAAAVTEGKLLPDNSSVINFEIDLKRIPARYVRVKAVNPRTVRSEESGKLNEAVLMTDEIIVE